MNYHYLKNWILYKNWMFNNFRDTWDNMYPQNFEVSFHPFNKSIVD